MLHLNNINTRTITAGQLAQICHAIQYARGNHEDGKTINLNERVRI